MNCILFALAFLAFAAVASADQGHEDHGPAHYKFDYSVHDPHTHDVKQQHEERNGHVVKGSYSLNEPDGTKRVVEYIADHNGGFNAVVKRIGHAQHPQHYHHGGAGAGAGAGSGSGGHHGGAESHVGVTHFGYHY